MGALRRPVLAALVVAGPPASGKSTLAGSLAGRLRAAFLDLDVVTGPLTGLLTELLGAEGDLDHPLVRTRGRAPRYETVVATACANLHIGTPVVLAAPFTVERSSPERWRRLSDRLAGAGGEARLVWLAIDDGELVRRLAARAAPRDRTKLADPAGFLASGSTTPPAVPHIRVDGAAPLRAQIDVVLAALD